jgi:sugar lactone lactonase YvrE
MSGTTLCSRCGAPVPWDGVTKTITCPFCQTVLHPSAMGAPVARNPAMVQGGGGGAATGCIIAAVVVAFVVLGGIFVAFFMVKRAATARAASEASVAIPVFTMPAITSTSPTVAAPLRVFGEEGNGPGQLTDARSIAVDLDENVYVADYSDGRVQKLDPQGKFQWIIQVPKNAFSGDDNIFGMTVDAKNVLWVGREGDLLKYATADGKAIGLIKGNYDSAWYKWIAIDPLGDIATTHNAAGNSDILLLDPNGKLKKRISNKDPAGLAIDGAGNVYWSDRWASAIEVLDPSGAMKARFGSKKDKHTSGVDALAVDGRGHVFAVTSEGINVFDQGGAYLQTLDTKAVKGAVRSMAVSVKNHLFVLGGNHVVVLDVSTLKG